MKLGEWHQNGQSQYKCGVFCTGSKTMPLFGDIAGTTVIGIHDFKSEWYQVWTNFPKYSTTSCKYAISSFNGWNNRNKH